ncbi:MAG: sulfotransferase, partial [Pseudomonadota bacterium]|nr:sulfotransferase [Pseudomonadota bacterium]
VARRDAAEVLESSVSLVASQSGMQSDSADLGRLTAEWQRKLALRQQRIERALGTFEGRVAHVDFARLNTDWEREIAQVYAALDIPLSQEALGAMRAEHDRAAGGQHTAHRRQIEEFAAG